MDKQKVAKDLLKIAKELTSKNVKAYTSAEDLLHLIEKENKQLVRKIAKAKDWGDQDAYDESIRISKRLSEWYHELSKTLAIDKERLQDRLRQITTR